MRIESRVKDITPQRWQEIDCIFAAALEHEPAERAAFLAEACGDDELLQKEVESLLAHDIPESLVGDAAVHQATRLLQKKAEPITPDRIGRYQIIRSLGAGGMGRVYLGLDDQLHRQVAVKLLSNYDATGEERMRRFRREALAASALNHPNILTIYEIGEFADANFIIAEFVDGVTLRSRMKAGELPTALALAIAIQIAGALSTAHEAGIIHRDIKPENVMVRGDGLVKVLDFGIAKFSQAGDSKEKDLVETTPGAIVGTASYMSPEQTRGLPIDPRADIWSLGVILYEMMAGCLPFMGKTPVDVIAATLEREPPPLPTNGSVMLEEFERIIFKTLQKEKENRYQSAADLLTDLEHLKQRLALAGESERSDIRRSTASREGVGPLVEPKIVNVVPAPTSAEIKTRPSAEYIANKIQHYKNRVLVFLVVFITVAGGFLVYRYFLSNKSQPIESIAVMPFANESGNPDIEYLSDGMTDLLINSLSQLPNLSVKARSSVFRYKDKEVEPQRIGSELSVQAILNGRIVQRGDDLTLYLSLVNARNGNQLWGEQYNRKLTDLVMLQQEIARDVSQKLRERLSGAEEQKLAKNYTENPEAYQLYLQGLYHWNKLSPPEIRKSLEYFQRAVDLDPNYALAHADIGRVYVSLAIVADIPSQEAFPKAREAAVRALKIDDTLAQAHTTLGWVKFWFDWDWNGAELEFQRALGLDPNVADTHIAYANVLTFTGRNAEALSQAHRARELEPLNLRIIALEGQTIFYAGKYDEAVVSLQKTIELEPSFFLGHLVLARVYVEKKMYSEAIAEAIKAGDFSGGHSEAVAHLVYALAKSGRREEALAALNELNQRAAEQRYVPPYNLALAHYGLGETDEAIAWLEKGLRQRDVRMTFLKVDPKWNNLRTDPHFTDIVRRVGFQQ